MNKDTSYLIKAYITKTLEDLNGVSADAYSTLMYLMQNDRDFALEMHDIIDRVAMQEGRYFLLKKEEMPRDEAYEL